LFFHNDNIKDLNWKQSNEKFIEKENIEGNKKEKIMDEWTNG